MLGIIDALLGIMSVISRYHDALMRLAVFVKCRVFAFHLLSTHRTLTGHSQDTQSSNSQQMPAQLTLSSTQGHTQGHSVKQRSSNTQWHARCTYLAGFCGALEKTLRREPTV